MISFPNLDQIKQRTRSDLSQTTELDATIRRSFLKAIADGLASRSFDLLKTIQQLVGQLFPQTATESFLRRWGDYQSLPPLAATGSTGTIVITGTVGTTLSDTANFIIQEEIFSLVSGVTISANSPTVVVINRTGSNAVVQTSGDHGLATGVTVTMSGADQPEYNGSFVILVITLNLFSYQVVGVPVTPATGTILATFDGVTGTVQSDGFGIVQNLDSGAQLNLTIPVVGIDTATFVQLDGLIGGTDLETDANYSDRIIEARSNVSTLFNVGQIIIEAKKIKGVTRVFVKETTPTAGQVEVYFLRDNDTPINPSASEITTVKDQLLLIKPAFIPDSSLFVLSPTLITTNFTFLDIVPDSTSMRDSIAANLKAFFTDEVKFETTVTSEAYSAAIQNSIDSEGNSLQSFLLSAPIGDIVVTTSEIAAFGSVVHV